MGCKRFADVTMDKVMPQEPDVNQSGTVGEEVKLSADAGGKTMSIASTGVQRWHCIGTTEVEAV
jgi:hypothetical protein